MTLQKIVISVGDRRTELLAYVEYGEADLSARRSLAGSFTGPKADFQDLLGPSLKGEVLATVGNMSYRLIDLKSDGSFLLASATLPRGCR